LDKQEVKRKSSSFTKFYPHKKTDTEIALHFLKLLGYPYGGSKMETSHEFVDELVVRAAKNDAEKMKNPCAKKFLTDWIDIYLAAKSFNPK
jgi:hypothetical protein